MRVGSLLYQEKEMEVGHFYYIEDSYFVDFPDPYLMKNILFALSLYINP